VLKKFIALVTIFSLFSVHANVAVSQSLKSAFDDLNYSLNVEWDQKDKAFYDSKMKGFAEQIGKMQANGLTNQDLIEFAKDQVKNDQVAQNIEAALNLIQINKMKPEEARKFALETVAKSYSTGANYSSTGAVIIATVLVVALVAVVIASGGNVYVSNPGGWCENVYVCDDYYDYWGYYLYSDCYYTTYCY
jgi:hypothetical protein